MGRSIVYEDSIQAVVSGIVKDLDEVTDFTFKEFISRATIETTSLKSQRGWDEWGSIDSHSQLFVKLAGEANIKQIEDQLAALRNRYREKEAEEMKDGTTHFLQPLRNIHLSPVYGIFEGSGRIPANKSILNSLLAVAAFLLGLGCINFINLTTAQAGQRAKEIGIRKTLGGGKGTLVYQFLCETFLFTLLATILSIMISPMLMQIFRDFIPPEVSFNSLNQPHVWIFLIVLLLTLSLLSGFYPTWVLAAFKPLLVLKNQESDGNGRSRKLWLRKTLTVTQFVITQVLLVGALAMGNQIHYSLNKDLGYAKEAIVFVDTERNIFSTEKDERRFVLLEKLQGIPEISHLSLASSPPASTRTNTRTMKYVEEGKVIETMVETKFADNNYFNIYKMRLVAGTNLQRSHETKEFVINETYAKWLGFENARDAIGKLLEIDGQHIPIVGVLADFHTKSTQEAIKPLAFSSSLANSYTIHIALPTRGGDTGVWQSALGSIERIYREQYPEDEFNYTFFDESIAAFYTEEQNIIRLLKWATALCMIISCLGLFGLVIYTTTQKTKEIGIRKVLGSSASQIIALLSKDIVLLVGYAFIIATPISYYSINTWLQGYQYKVNVEWSLYAGVGLIALLLSALTISFQTFKAANANPVKSLRTE
jgi:ABC-type antimicrobial peptide transport system permease subunit